MFGNFLYDIATRLREKETIVFCCFFHAHTNNVHIRPLGVLVKLGSIIATCSSFLLNENKMFKQISSRIQILLQCCKQQYSQMKYQYLYIRNQEFKNAKKKHESPKFEDDLNLQNPRIRPGVRDL